MIHFLGNFNQITSTTDHCAIELDGYPAHQLRYYEIGPHTVPLGSFPGQKCVRSAFANRDAATSTIVSLWTPAERAN